MLMENIPDVATAWANEHNFGATSIQGCKHMHPGRAGLSDKIMPASMWYYKTYTYILIVPLFMAFAKLFPVFLQWKFFALTRLSSL